MEYLIIMESNHIGSSMCECVGPGVTLCDVYCSDRCGTDCRFYCGINCVIRYCDGSVRAMPYMQGNTI